MRYTAKTYLENQKKWGKINGMIKDINELALETLDQRNKIYTLFSRMTQNISSRKKILPIEYKPNSHNDTKVKLGLFKGGVCYIHPNSQKARAISVSYSLIKLMCEHKNTFLNAIPNRNKREVMEVLLSNMSGFEREGKRISLTRKIGKNILYPDSNSFKPKHINDIVAELSIDNNEIQLFITYKPEKEERSNWLEEAGKKDISSNSLNTNIMKEQLYLDIWKLLTKVKRRAVKRHKLMKKRTDKLMADLTPILVADEI